ncbi:putative Lysophospholipase [Exiguobacterium sp. 8H]|uniref:alpha/beta fold hydrolase n=1 Tax=unclassified Exiguobacterium TaxID=2644629 RepID=UPI0012F18CFC|nr:MULTISPECIES: alpha/beta hydrolase [unclassified Exiguobacterium]VXB81554.1 Alpha/beta hydrolase fold protein [Exiguobacterium sp. 8A]VXC07688.1 putative Lysophospholipase [Exiguobacterium sp. 8H]
MIVSELTYPDGYQTEVMHVQAEQSIGKIFMFHGMLEHHERYIEFAQFMADNGYDVFVCDLRGAGTSAHDQRTYGHLTPGTGFQQLVEDAQFLIRQYEDGRPTYLIGHSFGSLLVRKLGQVMGHALSGIVVVAPPPHPGVAGELGHRLIATAMKRTHETHQSRFFERLLFGRYNLKFLPVRTDSDWLSSVPDEVDSYLADPNCGGLPSLGFLHEVTRASLDVTTSARIHEHPKSLPVLFVAGMDDPVTHDGEGLNGIIKKYRNADVELAVVTYDNARHEILREAHREQVWSDILAWMKQNIIH